MSQVERIDASEGIRQLVAHCGEGLHGQLSACRWLQRHQTQRSGLFVERVQLAGEGQRRPKEEAVAERMECILGLRRFPDELSVIQFIRLKAIAMDRIAERPAQSRHAGLKSRWD